MRASEQRHSLGWCTRRWRRVSVGGRLVCCFLNPLSSLLARLLLGSLGRSFHFSFGLGQGAAELRVALDVARQMLAQLGVQLLRRACVAERRRECRIFVVFHFLRDDVQPKCVFVLAGHGDHYRASGEKWHQFDEHVLSFLSSNLQTAGTVCLAPDPFEPCASEETAQPLSGRQRGCQRTFQCGGYQGGTTRTSRRASRPPAEKLLFTGLVTEIAHLIQAGSGESTL